MSAECLQKRIGSCLGCDILGLIVKRVNEQGIDIQKAGKQVAKELCPNDAIPQTHYIRHPRVLGMGQPKSNIAIIDL